MDKFHYLAFYKPFQTLSSFTTDSGKATLQPYFTRFPKDVYPLGRLDYDSEGLLLLTNDKSVNHALLDPKFQHEREYWIQVEGIPEPSYFEKMASGLIIKIKGKKFKTQPVRPELLAIPDHLPDRNPPVRYRKNIPTTWLRVCLKEGKNRQVRKMSAAAGNPVLRLIRYRMEKITLEDMQPGEVLSLPNMKSLLGL